MISSNNGDIRFCVPQGKIMYIKISSNIFYSNELIGFSVNFNFLAPPGADMLRKVVEWEENFSVDRAL